MLRSLFAIALVVPMLQAASIGFRHDNTGVYPDDCKPVTSWSEQDNIVWKTPLPNAGNGSPIVVGKRAFVVCEPGWTAEVPILVCIDVDSGKQLWRREIDNFDLLPAAEQQTAKDLRSSVWQLRHRAFHAWNNTPDAGGAGRDAFNELVPEVRKISFGLIAWNGSYKDAGVLAKRYAYPIPSWGMSALGWTMATPVSDGRFVYVYTMFNTLACYDLDGELRWMKQLNDFKQAAGGVGGTSSLVANPLIVEDSVIVSGVDNRMRRIRCEDGSEVWSAARKYHIYQVGSPQLMVLDGVQLIATASGQIIRFSDGRVLNEQVIGQFGKNDRFVTNGKDVLVGECGHSGGSYRPREGIAFGDKQYDKTVIAVQIAFDGPDKVALKLLWTGTGAKRNFLVHRDGVFIGAETAVDVYTGKVLANGPGNGRSAQSWAYIDGKFFGATPNKEDKGLSGSYQVIDGESLKRIADNTLRCDPLEGEKLKQYQSQIAPKGDTWYRWMVGRSLPFCSGNRLFIRTFDHLYCIGDPARPFVPSQAFAAR